MNRIRFDNSGRFVVISSALGRCTSWWDSPLERRWSITMTSPSAAGRIPGIAHRTPVATSAGRCGVRQPYVPQVREDAARRRIQVPRGVQRGQPVSNDGGRHGDHPLVGRPRPGDGARVSNPGLHTTIVMPQDAPPQKLAATRDYGAKVVVYDPQVARARRSRTLADQYGYVLIPPYDHPHIIAGQGTAHERVDRGRRRARLSVRAVRRRRAVQRVRHRGETPFARLSGDRRRAGSR